MRIVYSNPLMFKQSIIYFAFLLLLSSCRQESVTTLTIFKENGKFSWHEKEACRVKYSTNDESYFLDAKVKLRGGSSRKYSKHSFSLELERDFQFQGMPKDDDWIINANYIDKTFMRHKISYDLFREFDKDNIAPKCSYIELHINQKYSGLYVLMEEVNASMIGLNKDDTNAVLFKDPPIFYKDKLSWVREPENYYQQKFPKKKKLDKTGFIEAFQHFLIESSDNEFKQSIRDWVDIDNIVDWQIILLFSNNGDGITKNFYLYKMDKDTPLRFALWDYDHSYGRDGDNEKNMMRQELNCQNAILIERLFSVKNLRYEEKLQERWHFLRNKKIISLTNFKAHISKNQKIIQSHVKINFKKWPIDHKFYYDANSFEQELELMIEFVKIRIEQLDKRFNYS